MKRQVYGNLYTYPSGVVLAIMVARACQVMPASHPNVVLRFFFLFYTQWMSRHDRISPVYITTSLQGRGRVPGMPEPWDPALEKFSHDLLPVLNPAYPFVNDANAVGRCGLEVFYSEVTRAHHLLSTTESFPLEDVWKPYSITDDFSSFLLVQVSCDGNSEEGVENDLEVWSSYVASKLRILIYAVECIVDARPYPHKLKDRVATSLLGPQHIRRGCVFLIGVRERKDRQKLHQSMFSSALDEFRYAVQDGCSSTKGSRVFQRDERSMHGPRLTLIDTLEALTFLNK
ncbi:Poly(A) polymerase central domain [Trypanosoma vivax]|nr:poly(A) polymerase [Trypanosoma vivax]KAH8605781.1 Poly(A) polymerase central domain [Trypanosoma vivax]